MYCPLIEDSFKQKENMKKVERISEKNKNITVN